MDDFLHKTIGPLVLEKFVISSIIVFFSGWMVLLFLIFGGRRSKLKWLNRKNDFLPALQKELYSLLFIDLSEAEWDGYLNKIKKEKGKKEQWAIEVLVSLKRQYSGFCGERIIRVFVETGWKQKMQKQANHRQWNKKLKAIRTLAEMEQTDDYEQIKSNLFHSQELVRDEVAVAMIRLKGFKAILDLLDLEGEISDWSQIQIIQALKIQEDQDKKWIYPLVTHSNPSLKKLGSRLLVELDPTQYVQDSTVKTP